MHRPVGRPYLDLNALEGFQRSEGKEWHYAPKSWVAAGAKSTTRLRDCTHKPIGRPHLDPKALQDFQRSACGRSGVSVVLTKEGDKAQTLSDNGDGGQIRAPKRFNCRSPFS